MSLATGYLRLASISFAMATALACAENDADPSHDTAGALVEEEAPGAPSPSPEPAPAMTPRGLNQLAVGMTADEAAARAGDLLTIPDSAKTGCHHVTTRLPGRVLAMLVDGRIARLEVHEGPLATDAGIRIGDPAARVDSAYAGRMTSQPHKYTDGRYLIVRSTDPADSLYQLIFETEGSRIAKYRAGLMPMVGWVEGCS